ncbi:hypothetical protein [Actinocorallia populi]|uniref:hypothetical protein n=1 Tax=Actinocorallia populi TaxID=2079200 RepID=UPI0013009D3A|nr:hypothetical protein [Actinocorallia populi]
MGDYRSVPARPRWDGPGWGTVVLAGVVVAGMGWAVLAERGEGDAPAAAVGAVPGGNGAAAVVLGGERGREREARRVPVAWVRKTGAGERPDAGEATRAADSAPRRVKAAPRKRVEPKRRAAEPVRRAEPARAVRYAKADAHRRVFRAVPPVGPRSAGDPVANALSGLVGRECERQAAGAGLFCAAVMERVFADQAHGGR